MCSKQESESDRGNGILEFYVVLVLNRKRCVYFDAPGHFPGGLFSHDAGKSESRNRVGAPTIGVCTRVPGTFPTLSTQEHKVQCLVRSPSIAVLAVPPRTVDSV